MEEARSVAVDERAEVPVLEPVVSGAVEWCSVSGGGSGEVKRRAETTMEEVARAEGADWCVDDSENAGMPSPFCGEAESGECQMENRWVRWWRTPGAVGSQSVLEVSYLGQ